MEISVKKTEVRAKQCGMYFDVHHGRDGGIAIIKYKNLVYPGKLACVASVLAEFLEENRGITISAMTEIHDPLTGNNLWVKIKNLFKKSKPIGVLIVYKKG